MASDARFTWLDRRVGSSLSTYLTLSNSDERQINAVLEFFNRIDLRALFVWLSKDNGPQTLLADAEPPHLHHSGKIVVFRKRHTAGTLTAANIAVDTITCEYRNSAWDEVVDLSEQIYVPWLAMAIQQHANDPAHPRVISLRKAFDNYQKFLATLQVTHGQVLDDVVLPLPISLEHVFLQTQADSKGTSTTHLSKRDAVPVMGRDRLHALEGIVVVWSRVIRSTLRAGRQTLVTEPNTGPLAEVQALKKHADSLQSLVHQLVHKPIVGQLLDVLIDVASPMAYSFAALETELRQALVTTRLNLRMLQACQPFFEALEEGDLTAVNRSLRPLLHCLTLLWRHSERYRQPSRLQAVLRAICNKLIRRCQAHVATAQGSEFTPRITRRLRDALRTCALMRGSYLDARQAALARPTQPDDLVVVSDRELAEPRATPAGLAEQNTLTTDDDAQTRRMRRGEVHKMLVPNADREHERQRQQDEITQAATAAWPDRTHETFARLNAFMERCNDVLDIAEAAIQLDTLRDLQLGGPRGSTLSDGLHELHMNHVPIIEAFKQLNLDVLDIDNEADKFQKGFFALQLGFKDIEQQVVAILRLGFQSCYTLTDRLKLTTMVDNLMQRHPIARGLEAHVAKVMDDTLEELRACEAGLDAIDNGPEHRVPTLHQTFQSDDSLAAFDGVMAHRRRVFALQALLPSHTLGEVKQEIKSTIRRLLARTSTELAAIQGRWIKAHEAQADPTANAFRRPLLLELPPSAGILAPRFVVNLTESELHFLHELQGAMARSWNLPSALEELQPIAQDLIQTHTMLQRALVTYHRVAAEISDYQRDILRDALPRAVAILREGCVQRIFLSADVPDFLQTLRIQVVKTFEPALDLIQRAQGDIENRIAQWKAHCTVRSILVPTSPAPPFRELQAHLDEFLSRTQAMLLRDSNAIGRLLEEIHQACFVSRSSPDWTRYLTTINDRVQEGLQACTLQLLNELMSTVCKVSSPKQTRSRHRVSFQADQLGEGSRLMRADSSLGVTGAWAEPAPALMRIEVLLVHDGIVHSPALRESDAGQQYLPLIAACQGWFDSFLELSTFVESPTGADFHATFKHHPEVESLRSRCRQQIERQAAIALAALAAFEPFRCLYNLDPGAIFHDFLSSRDAILRNEGMRQLAEKVDVPMIESRNTSRKFGSNLFGRRHDLATLSEGQQEAEAPSSRPGKLSRYGSESQLNMRVPTLEEIATCLRVFSAAAEQLHATSDSIDCGFFSLDLLPLLSTLRARASNWRFTFGRFVLDKAERTIVRLSNHLSLAHAGTVDLQHNLDVSFMSILSFFHEVAARQDEIEGKLGPLHRSLEMLREHDLHISTELAEIYRTLRPRLNAILKVLDELKLALAPRFAREGQRIKEQLAQFEEKLHAAYNNLLSCSAFSRHTNTDEARELIAEHSSHVEQLEAEARELTQLQKLTGYSIVDFDRLHAVEEHLIHLDEVTGLRDFVARELDPYLDMAWTQVDLSEFRQTVEAKQALIDELPAPARSWDVTQGVAETLQALQSAIPALESLNSDHLRSRHWKRLFQETGNEDIHDDAVVRSWPLRQLVAWLPADRHDLVNTVVQTAHDDLKSEVTLKSYDERWMTCVFRMRTWTAGVRHAGEATSLALKPEDVGANAAASGALSHTSAIYLVEGLNDVFNMIKEHQQLLTGLSQDAGSRVLRGEISDTQSKLRNIETVVLELSGVQRLWLQLLEVFSTEPSDQQGAGAVSSVAQLMARRKTRGSVASHRHSSQGSNFSWGEKKSVLISELPKEAALLLKVHNDLRALLFSVSRDPAVLSFCLRPGISQLLQNYHKSLLTVASGVMAHLDSRRDTFGRFFFLSRADLLQVHCEAGHPELINKSIHKLYPEIGRLLLEYQGRTAEIRAVYSTLGERWDLDVPVPILGSAARILASLDRSMRVSLRHQLFSLLEDGVEELSALDREGRVRTDFTMNWINDRAAQVVFVFLVLQASQEEEQALTGHYTVDAVRAARDRQLQEVATLLSGATSKADEHKLYNIMVALTYLRSRLECFPGQERANATYVENRLRYLVSADEIHLASGPLREVYAHIMQDIDTIQLLNLETEADAVRLLWTNQLGAFPLLLNTPDQDAQRLVQLTALLTGRAHVKLLAHADAERQQFAHALAGLTRYPAAVFVKHMDQLSANLMPDVAALLDATTRAMQSKQKSFELLDSTVQLDGMPLLVTSMASTHVPALLRASCRPLSPVDGHAGASDWPLLLRAHVVIGGAQHAGLRLALVELRRLLSSMESRNTEHALRRMFELFNAARLTALTHGAWRSESGEQAKELMLHCFWFTHGRSLTRAEDRAVLRAAVQHYGVSLGAPDGMDCDASSINGRALEADIKALADVFQLDLQASHFLSAVRQYENRDRTSLTPHSLDLRHLALLLDLHPVAHVRANSARDGLALVEQLRAALQGLHLHTQVQVVLPSAFAGNGFAGETLDQSLWASLLTHRFSDSADAQERDPTAEPEEELAHLQIVVLLGVLSPAMRDSLYQVKTQRRIVLPCGSSARLDECARVIWLDYEPSVTGDELPDLALLGSRVYCRRSQVLRDLEALVASDGVVGVNLEELANIAAEFCDTFSALRTTVPNALNVTSVLETWRDLSTSLFGVVQDELGSDLGSHIAYECLGVALVWATILCIDRECEENWEPLAQADRFLRSRLAQFDVRFVPEVPIWQQRPGSAAGITTFAHMTTEPIITTRKAIAEHDQDEVLVATPEVEAIRFVAALCLRAGRNVGLSGPSGSAKSRILETLSDMLTDMTGAERAAVHLSCTRRLTGQAVWQNIRRHFDMGSGLEYGPASRKAGVLVVLDDVQDLASPTCDVMQVLHQLAVVRMVFDSESFRSGLGRQLRGLVLAFATTTDPLALNTQLKLDSNLAQNCLVLSLTTPRVDIMQNVMQATIKRHLLQPDGYTQVSMRASQSGMPSAEPSVAWASPLAQCTCHVHEAILGGFGVAPHRLLYRFTPHDVMSVAAGLCCALSPLASEVAAVRVWAALMTAVYGLRMAVTIDQHRFQELLRRAVKQTFARALLDEASAVWLKENVFYSENLATSGTVAGVNGIVAAHDADGGKAAQILRGLMENEVKECAQRYSAFHLHLAQSHLHHMCHMLSSSVARLPRTDFWLFGHECVNAMRLHAHIAGRRLCVAEGLDAGDGGRRFQMHFVELLMLSATRDERITFAVDSNQASIEVLDVIASFVTGKDVSDLLSTDNLVAVSTLVQPRVVALGMVPTQRNIMLWFHENARRNLQVCLFTSDDGVRRLDATQHVLRSHPRLVQHINIVNWTSANLKDWTFQASQVLGTGGLAEAEVAVKATLFGRCHQAAWETAQSLPGSHYLDPALKPALDDAAHWFLRFDELLSAYYSARLARLEHGVQMTINAEAHLSELRAQHERLEGLLKERDNVGLRLLAQLGRDVSAQRKLQQAVLRKEREIAELEEKVAPLLVEYEEAMSVTRGHVEALRALVDQIGQDQLREVQAMNRPPDAVESVFAALLLLLLRGSNDTPLSDSELVWRTGGRRLCADAEKLRLQLHACEVAKISEARLNEIQELLEDAEVVKMLAAGPGTSSPETKREVTTPGRIASPRDSRHIPACVHVLARWAKGALILHRQLNNHTRAKEIQINGLRRLMHDKTEDLRSLRQSNGSLEKRVATLRANVVTSTRQRNDDATALAQLGDQLEQAQNFLRSLELEKQEWKAAIEHIRSVQVRHTGDCLVASLARSYLPCFPEAARTPLLATWLDILAGNSLSVSHVPATSGAPLEEILQGLFPLMARAEDKLAADIFCDTSALFVNRAAITCSTHWSLALDPDHMTQHHVMSMYAASGGARAVDMRIGATSWERLETELDEALACSSVVLCTHAPARPSPEFVQWLRRAYQRSRSGHLSFELDDAGHVASIHGGAATASMAGASTQAVSMVAPGAGHASADLANTSGHGHLPNGNAAANLVVMGPALDQGAWFAELGTVLRLVNYDNLSEPSLQAVLGSLLMARSYSNAHHFVNQTLSQLQQLKRAIASASLNLVDTFTGLAADATRVAETVELKADYVRQLAERKRDMSRVRVWQTACRQQMRPLAILVHLCDRIRGLNNASFVRSQDLVEHYLRQLAKASVRLGSSRQRGRPSHSHLTASSGDGLVGGGASQNGSSATPRMSTPGTEAGSTGLWPAVREIVEQLCATVPDAQRAAIAQAAMLMLLPVTNVLGRGLLQEQELDLGFDRPLTPDVLLEAPMNLESNAPLNPSDNASIASMSESESKLTVQAEVNGQDSTLVPALWSGMTALGDVGAPRPPELEFALGGFEQLTASPAVPPVPWLNGMQWARLEAVGELFQQRCSEFDLLAEVQGDASSWQAWISQPETSECPLPESLARTPLEREWASLLLKICLDGTRATALLSAFLEWIVEKKLMPKLISSEQTPDMSTFADNHPRLLVIAQHEPHWPENERIVVETEMGIAIQQVLRCGSLDVGDLQRALRQCAATGSPLLIEHLHLQPGLVPILLRFLRQQNAPTQPSPTRRTSRPLSRASRTSRPSTADADGFLADPRLAEHGSRLGPFGVVATVDPDSDLFRHSAMADSVVVRLDREHASIGKRLARFIGHHASVFDQADDMAVRVRVIQLCLLHAASLLQSQGAGCLRGTASFDINLLAAVSAVLKNREAAQPTPNMPGWDAETYCLAYGRVDHRDFIRLAAHRLVSESTAPRIRAVLEQQPPGTAGLICVLEDDVLLNTLLQEVTVSGLDATPVQLAMLGAVATDGLLKPGHEDEALDRHRARKVVEEIQGALHRMSTSLSSFRARSELYLCRREEERAALALLAISADCTKLGAVLARSLHLSTDAQQLATDLVHEHVPERWHLAPRLDLRCDPVTYVRALIEVVDHPLHVTETLPARHVLSAPRLVGQLYANHLLGEAPGKETNTDENTTLLRLTGVELEVLPGVEVKPPMPLSLMQTALKRGRPVEGVCAVPVILCHAGKDQQRPTIALPFLNKLGWECAVVRYPVVDDAQGLALLVHQAHFVAL